MKSLRLPVMLAGALSLCAAVACSDSNVLSPDAGGTGTLVVQLTDAPFLVDSLRSVDIFVVRVDARGSDADSASSDHALTDDSSSTNGWKTVASPNASFNLLSLQNGVAATLGEATLAAGTYNGFRLIIDPVKSSVTLKNGRVLSGSSSPSVTFPSASKSGIKIVLSQPVTITGGTTTNLLVDFDVNNSFVMRGNTIDKNGLLFKPVIKATVTNTALTNASIRLVNATGNALSLNQNGTALSGASNIAFGAASSCSSVNAATPALTVTQSGSTTALAGFTPVLSAGNSYTVVAYPSATGSVQFVTLGNSYTPTTGQTGLRVFNATTGTTGFDAFVTTAGLPLGTATVSGVAAGTSSSFVSVPPGTYQVRLTSAGSSTVLVDLTGQTLTAGQNMTLVIAPPAAGTTTPRAFLIAGC
jgi:hypothetical protein